MSAESIARLRKLFEEELSQHPTLYHPVDIDRVRTEQWQIKRYLLSSFDSSSSSSAAHAQIDERPDAFHALCKALQWKKAFGVHDRTDQHFPKEFWELSQIEINGRDKEGRPIQWVMIRGRRSFKETNLLSRQFVAHILEGVDRAGGEKGFTVVHDTNGSGLANVDLEQTKFNNMILEHYPGGIRAMYVVDLPWLLNVFTRLALSIMNPKLRQLVHFVSASELLRDIEPKYIPTRLEGGERERGKFPEGTRPLEQCYMGLDLDERFVDHFYAVYKMQRPSSSSCNNNNNNGGDDSIAVAAQQ